MIRLPPLPPLPPSIHLTVSSEHTEDELSQGAKVIRETASKFSLEIDIKVLDCVVTPFMDLKRSNTSSFARSLQLLRAWLCIYCKDIHMIKTAVWVLFLRFSA